MENKHTCNQTVTVHTPVLLREVTDILVVAQNDIVVDGTVGGAGHTQAILALLGPDGRYIGIDADHEALARAEHMVGEDERCHFIEGNFRDIDRHVADAGIETVDKILLDIGLSSDQLSEENGRGFSFKHDEPLKMTFSVSPQEGTLTAWHVVNEWSESSLCDIIYGFGGERKARRIAHAIVEAREAGAINSSKRLADVIAEASFTKGHIHPATKTFQAIRMAVNDELGALEEVLEKSKHVLREHGRIAVITFHSLEDRMVKRVFRDWEEQSVGVRITKKPITPSREECKENKRARSAKLRCFQKQ